jgi:hypothetical protein
MQDQIQNPQVALKDDFSLMQTYKKVKLLTTMIISDQEPPEPSINRQKKKNSKHLKRTTEQKRTNPQLQFVHSIECRINDTLVVGFFPACTTRLLKSGITSTLFLNTQIAVGDLATFFGGVD